MKNKLVREIFSHFHKGNLKILTLYWSWTPVDEFTSVRLEQTFKKCNLQPTYHADSVFLLDPYWAKTHD
jgi:hypothetical protein